jgi:hypothetical protein
MAGEDARVEALVCDDKALICGENDLFWIEVIVNGFKDFSINASSMQDAERMAPEVERLVKSVYRKAYRDGYHSCQQVIKDSLGLPR